MDGTKLQLGGYFSDQHRSSTLWFTQHTTITITERAVGIMIGLFMLNNELFINSVF